MLFWVRFRALCCGFAIRPANVGVVLRDGSVDIWDRIVVWWEGSGICRVRVVVTRYRLFAMIW
ncbi:hypothetical protein [Cognatiyoonia sp. IB215182]|uniref:hypothetical protein n=1 Tax=Cognatiyoonia sp. IB215182 TaxID=3097353 RepID=UPI002A0F97E9|nr:hypothetical protein [Cognatiyoonia sp. IB215182]MDX8354522.1 hypothetical protein [Cognatiyoonia sp. IB215182]